MSVLCTVCLCCPATAWQRSGRLSKASLLCEIAQADLCLTAKWCKHLTSKYTCSLQPLSHPDIHHVSSFRSPPRASRPIVQHWNPAVLARTQARLWYPCKAVTHSAICKSCESRVEFAHRLRSRRWLRMQHSNNSLRASLHLSDRQANSNALCCCSVHIACEYMQ